MEPPFSIREYRPEDEAQLREMIVTFQDTPEIFDASFEKSGQAAEPLIFQRLMQQMAGGGAVLVAEPSGKEGALIGFGAAEIQKDEDHTETFFYISDLFVKPEWQEKGIGSLLLETLEDRARKAGIKFASIAVLSRNAGAERLYRRFGFEDYKRTLLKRLP